MTVHQFAGLGKTFSGRTTQIARGYRGMADEMARKQAAAPEDDAPQTLEAAKRVIAYLEQKLADAEALIEEMRADANEGIPSGASGTYWDSKRVARESNAAVCTICRNADVLGGIKLGGDWLFPAGTVYGKKRKRAK